MIAKVSLLVILIAVCCNVAYMFSTAPLKFSAITSTAHSKSAVMAGGRNKAEVGLSKRQMFQQLKDKLNNESKAPGFFEVGDGPADVELYCKGNNDGTQIGDCVSAQFVQLVLLKKGVRYDIKPTLSSNKPAWIVEKHNGHLPLLLHKDVAMTESLAIAEYIEKTFPHTSLTRQGAFSYQEVIEKTANFFPRVKAYIMNKDDSKDAELLAAVDVELDILDEVIRSTPGQYACGIELTLADLYLLPQMFNAMVAMDHFKGVEFYHISGEPSRPALEHYFGRMLAMEEFNNKKCYVNVDQVINGWKIARGDV